MYLCKFGQNESTGLENNTQNQYFGHFKVRCDFESIYASLVKMNPLVQKITHRTNILDISKCAVTLKMRSRSPKSNQLVPPSQQCIFASLVKIHQLVQKITHGKEAMQTRTRIRTKNPSGWGDIMINNNDPFY